MENIDVPKKIITFKIGQVRKNTSTGEYEREKKLFVNAIHVDTYLEWDSKHSHKRVYVKDLAQWAEIAVPAYIATRKKLQETITLQAQERLRKIQNEIDVLLL